MNGLAYSNADCYFGDHEWRGGGVCVGCDARLRCACGAFAKEADAWWEAHVPRCAYLLAVEQDDIDQITRSWP